MKIIDLTMSDEGLTDEQQAFDDHNDIVSELSVNDWLHRWAPWLPQMLWSYPAFLQGKLKDIEASVQSMDEVASETKSLDWRVNWTK